VKKKPTAKDEPVRDREQQYESFGTHVLNTNSIYLPTNQNNFNINNDLFSNEEINKMNLRMANNFENFNNTPRINSLNSISSSIPNNIHSPRDIYYSGNIYYIYFMNLI